MKDLEWDVISSEQKVHITLLVHLALWALTKQSKLAFGTPGGLIVEIDATLMLDKPHAVMVLTMIVHTSL